MITISDGDETFEVRKEAASMILRCVFENLGAIPGDIQEMIWLDYQEPRCRVRTRIEEWRRSCLVDSYYREYDIPMDILYAPVDVFKSFISDLDHKREEEAKRKREELEKETAEKLKRLEIAEYERLKKKFENQT